MQDVQALLYLHTAGVSTSCQCCLPIRTACYHLDMTLDLLEFVLSKRLAAHPEGEGSNTHCLKAYSYIEHMFGLTNSLSTEHMCTRQPRLVSNMQLQAIYQANLRFPTGLALDPNIHFILLYSAPHSWQPTY